MTGALAPPCTATALRPSTLPVPVITQHGDNCFSQRFAVREDEALTVDDFDCLRCRFTFRLSGAAHVVGTLAGRFPRAFCDCDWRYMLDNPDELSRARRRWRMAGVAFSADELRLQTPTPSLRRGRRP